MKLFWKVFLILLVVLCLAAGTIPLGLFPGRAIPVLMYHHITSGPGVGALEVSRKNFRMQMQYLKENNYRVVDPATLGALIVGGKKPRKTVVLTFDDGFQDNFENALPILEEYGFKATFFIVTDWVGKPGCMTWDEIRTLLKNGHTIGSHTVSHQFLTEISLAKAKEEIYNSKRLMQEILSTPVIFLCYPAGRFNPSVKALVKEAGYEAAFATSPGWAYSNRDPFAIKRIRISESSDTPLQFWWRVAGYYVLFRERKVLSLKMEEIQRNACNLF